MSNSLFSVDVYTQQTLPSAYLNQYGALRYKCFLPDDPNVNMDNKRKIELDHFDKEETTLYIMVTLKKKNQPTELISAVRLIPTMVDYELEMASYRYLTHNVELPKSPKIYEANRWVGKSSRTYLGQMSTALLMMRLYQLSLEKGFEELIGTVTTKGEEWLQKRDSATDRASDIYHVEQENIDILVSRFPMDEAFAATGKQLMVEAMQSVSITNLSVDDAVLEQASVKKAV